MIELGLIGYPLGHSFSPGLHAAALKSCGLDGRYSLFPIQPEDQMGLKNLLERVRAGQITGLNVTLPHKQNVIRYLDEMTPTADAIGAVNTIYLRDRKLVGDNTDAPGFLLDLKRVLAMETRRHRELNALVLGAGGSARAVVYALGKDGWQVTLAARRMEQARQLVESYTGHPRPRLTDFTLLKIELSSISLIVNATPAGMTPNIHLSPWPENIPFPVGAVIYDLVYNPRQTKLVRDACLQGLAAANGLGMLIEQAALSFELWTGCKPVRENLFETVNPIAR